MNFELIFLLLFSLSASAQPARQAIAENPNLAASNLLAYPGPRHALTPTPQGYEPFYISHYGRHGSRYLISEHDYDDPYLTLRSADSLGLLTPTGREVLTTVTRMRSEAYMRLGELTPLGAEQHRDIARRMMERFPEVLSDTAHIDARSTIVIRCILSMSNALQQLSALNPRLRISEDASRHDMFYMNDEHSRYDQLRRTPEAAAALKAFDSKHNDFSHLMATLFADTTSAYIRSIDTDRLARHLLDLASSLQGTRLRNEANLWPIFTPDEIYQYWLRTNAFWYMYYGPSRETRGAGMYMQTRLARNIIATADSCLRLPHPGATLRFGHESVVMPLVCLLNINGYGRPAGPIDSLEHRGWINYDIYPMGCNVQMVFYRRKATSEQPIKNKTAMTKNAIAPNVADDDLLVKILLNEDEATLPLPTTQAPYYRWQDVRAYWLERIADKD